MLVTPRKEIPNPLVSFLQENIGLLHIPVDFVRLSIVSVGQPRGRRMPQAWPRIHRRQHLLITLVLFAELEEPMQLIIAWVEAKLTKRLDPRSPGWPAACHELTLCRNDPEYMAAIIKEGPECLSKKERLLRHCLRRAATSNIYCALIQVVRYPVMPSIGVSSALA